MVPNDSLLQVRSPKRKATKQDRDSVLLPKAEYEKMKCQLQQLQQIQEIFAGKEKVKLTIEAN